MLPPFANKVAVVTGGSSGIGLALCEALAQREAIPVVADIHSEQANEVARALAERHGAASAAHVDVADAGSVESLVRDTVEKHGRIDYMFNNAGVAWMGKFEDMSLADVDRLVEINLLGVLYGTWAVYPVMVRQRFGHIVNIASLFGLVPIQRQSVYAATKHGIVSFSTSLNEEARSLGVRVSVACPGLVVTSMLRNGQGPLGGARASRGILGATWCAQSILKGVTRNKCIIIPPLYNWVLWWIYRASPAPFSTVRWLNRVLRRLSRFC